MAKNMRKLTDMNVENKVVKDFFLEIIYTHKNTLQLRAALSMSITHINAVLK